MGHLIALMKGLTKPHHRVRITNGAHLDLLMWLQFLSHFNEVSTFLHHNCQSNEALGLYTGQTNLTPVSHHRAQIFNRGFDRPHSLSA